jgi:hypothetical protein
MGAGDGPQSSLRGKARQGESLPVNYRGQASGGQRAWSWGLRPQAIDWLKAGTPGSLSGVMTQTDLITPRSTTAPTSLIAWKLIC